MMKKVIVLLTLIIFSGTQIHLSAQDASESSALPSAEVLKSTSTASVDPYPFRLWGYIGLGVAPVMIFTGIFFLSQSDLFYRHSISLYEAYLNTGDIYYGLAYQQVFDQSQLYQFVGIGIISAAAITLGGSFFGIFYKDPKAETPLVSFEPGIITNQVKLSLYF